MNGCIATQSHIHCAIDFDLIDCKTARWKNRHIGDWHHPATCTDAFLGRIRCGICGTEYRRVNHAGKLVTWYCYDRKQKLHGCTNRNYPDFVIRQMVAEIMDTDDFDETAFNERVDYITADPGETITLHFKDGRTAQWQRI